MSSSPDQAAVSAGASAYSPRYCQLTRFSNTDGSLTIRIFDAKPRDGGGTETVELTLDYPTSDVVALSLDETKPYGDAPKVRVQISYEILFPDWRQEDWFCDNASTNPVGRGTFQVDLQPGSIPGRNLPVHGTVHGICAADVARFPEVQVQGRGSVTIDGVL